MASKIYLIREINCYVPTTLPLMQRISFELGIIRSVQLPGFASIWCAPSFYDSKQEDHDYTLMGIKLAGPLPEKEADQFLQQLKDILEASNIEVEIQETADD